ncbi:uncharacterized protein LOC106643495 [Copidosoma floridanum]|uniref:uncharacterized protein LOC106643495 n=1 Tax=Copidosoma floridanum TaxID=29053 RepID=UPI0006C9508E|nr:uncharacterized protein LOC106643495 [Copidosoma floridanum]
MPGDGTLSLHLKALCIPHLGLSTPAAPLDPSILRVWASLQDLADPDFGLPRAVDILIGAEVYSRLLCPGFHQRGEIVGQHTALGWTLVGCAPGRPLDSAVACPTLHDELAPPWHRELVMLLQRFWELKEVPSVCRRAPDDIDCERIFANYQRDADGRYIVRLPMKPNAAPLLGDSLASALASLRSLHHRLQWDSKMATEYNRFMSKYLALGHMKQLSSRELSKPSSTVCYVPHHGIWQHGNLGPKLRVVFNASHPTTSGYSLNDILHSGPRLQAALPTVLLRWRRHRVAFCSYVQMMFRQIWVDPRDADLQRIVWSPDPSQPPVHYQLRTVTYGATCSPYLSLRVIQQLCHDEGHLWPDAVPVVMNDRYVDDIHLGADDLETARQLRDQEACLRPTWRELSDAGLVSELGISWDPDSDTFRLTPPAAREQDTKRSILAGLASLFDPCGWLTPTILQAKLLVQDLWRARLDWDEVVPASMALRWSAFTTELKSIQGFFIPRWIGSSAPSKIHLHAFSDASRRAMGAVVYSQLQDSSGQIRCRILLAKTKLAPIRSLKPSATPQARMTIPHLKLRAALLAAKLLHLVVSEWNIPIEPCYAWCDFQVVLHWLRSAEPTNHTLVDNYVTHVQEVLTPHIWRYVLTHDNPADVASQGTDAQTLHRQQTWWTGPSRLSKGPDRWPQEPSEPPQPSPPRLCNVTQKVEFDLLQLFSDLGVLLRTLTHLRRWARLHLGQAPTRPMLSAPTATEVTDAYLACVRLSQQRAFSDELALLRTGRALLKRHPLTSLAAFVHTDGVLRVGGCLQHAEMTFAEQHPPILASACPLTTLTIAWAHHRALHGGFRTTSAYTVKRAWIIGGTRKVQAFLRS